jgi:hypothetical protein
MDDLTEYYVVEVNDRSIVYDWLKKTFGPQGDRWFCTGNKIYFRNEQDYIWFELYT